MKQKSPGDFREEREGDEGGGRRFKSRERKNFLPFQRVGGAEKGAEQLLCHKN